MERFPRTVVRSHSQRREHKWKRRTTLGSPLVAPLSLLLGPKQVRTLKLNQVLSLHSCQNRQPKENNGNQPKSGESVVRGFSASPIGFVACGSGLELPRSRPDPQTGVNLILFTENSPVKTDSLY